MFFTPDTARWLLNLALGLMAGVLVLCVILGIAVHYLCRSTDTEATAPFIAEVTVRSFCATTVRWRGYFTSKRRAYYAVRAYAFCLDHFGLVHSELGIDYSVRDRVAYEHLHNA